MEPPKPPALRVEYIEQLADFEARDLSGKTWSISDLRGKATLVCVWAAAMGSSRTSQLPQLQRIYERIQGRQDLQVLSFNIDEIPYLAQKCVEEDKLSFPIIIARTLGERLFPQAGLPRWWIIDAQGRRSTPFPFRNADLVLAEMEKVASAK